MNPQRRHYGDRGPAAPIEGAEDERLEQKRRKRVVELAEKIFAAKGGDIGINEALGMAEEFFREADEYLKTGK